MPDIPDAEEFDLLDYRRALGGFGTGVALVAARDADGRAHGLIINSFTSVSLKPPVVLWCLNDSCAAFEVFAHSEAFTVNILDSRGEDLARQFSRRGDRIIPEGQIRSMSTGAPAIADAVTSLDCRMRQRLRVGDHEVIFGDVAAYSAEPEGDALGYFRGRFVRLSAG